MTTLPSNIQAKIRIDTNGCWRWVGARIENRCLELGAAPYELAERALATTEEPSDG